MAPAKGSITVWFMTDVALPVTEAPNDMFMMTDVHVKLLKTAVCESTGQQQKI